GGTRPAPGHVVYVPPRHDVRPAEPPVVEGEEQRQPPGPRRPDPLSPTPPESAPHQPAPASPGARRPAPVATANRQEVEERLMRWGLDGLPATARAPAR